MIFLCGFLLHLQIFPKGSPLVGDISRAILNVTEGDEMKQIENKWFKLKESNCPDSQARVSSNSLSVGSFWGLFLIAGIASVVSLAIFITTFLHKHRQILLGSGDSMWKRIRAIFKSYDQKDLSSHTFRKNDKPEDHHVGTDICPNLQNSNFPPSPSSYLVDTGPNSPISRERGTLSSGRFSPEVVPENIELIIQNNAEITGPNSLATNV